MCNLERLAAVVDCILERHELVHRESGSVVEGVKQELRQVATQTQTWGQDAPILPPQLRQHVIYNAPTRTAALAAQLVRLQNLKEEFASQAYNVLDNAMGNRERIAEEAQEAEDQAKQQDTAAQQGRGEWRQRRAAAQEANDAANKTTQQEREAAQQRREERRQIGGPLHGGDEEAKGAARDARHKKNEAAQHGRDERRQKRVPLHGGNEEGKEAARKAKQQEQEAAQQQNKARRQKRVLPQRADGVEHEAVIETARLRIRGTASVSPNKVRYKRPRKRAHEVDRKYACAHCHRGYGNASSLHLHVRLKHPHGTANCMGGAGEEREENDRGGEGGEEGHDERGEQEHQ